MKRSTSGALAAALMLSACTSTSFAPPNVPLTRRMTDLSVAANCAPTYPNPQVTIDRNVAGALALTDNFILGYRCGMRAAADGKQPWDILAFLAQVGATAAVALGAGADVAIVGTAAGRVFGAARGYYDPVAQTAILNDAVDALVCIQTESVGISAYEIQAAANAERGALRTLRGGNGPEVTVETQYFNMVAAALLQVERVAAARLAGRGTAFDAAGIAAEIRRLAEERDKAEQQRDSEDGDPPAGVVGLDATTVDQLRTVHSVQLDLNVLRPKLQDCVVRAKV